MNDIKKNIGPKGCKPQPRWSKAIAENIIRANASGLYFLSARVGGKSYLYSLKTTNLDEAKEARDRELKNIRDGLAQGNDGKGSLTLREAIAKAQAEFCRRNELPKHDAEALADKTLISYKGVIAKLTESEDYAIPAADLDQPIKKVAAADLKKWFHPIKRDFGATLVNTTKIVLSEAFEIALKACACRVNLATELKGVKQAPKEVTLATPEQWTALVENIRANADPRSVEQREIVRVILANYTKNVETNYALAFAEHPEWKTALGLADDSSKKAWHRVYDLAHYVRHEENAANRRGQESADRVVFLSYSGARAAETTALTWDTVDFARGVIAFPRDTVKGQTRTKAVQINDEILPVLRRCQERARLRGDNKVFGIKTANKAIRNACKRLGLPHWSEHDFRHLFATTLLENGAPALLVAEALGQSDKGISLHRTYAHANAKIAGTFVRGLRFGVKPDDRGTQIAALKAQLAALEAEQPKNVIALAS